jgi:acetyl-CoA synthetase (ADP-forming)
MTRPDAAAVARLIAAARAQKRPALDEPSGKQVLTAFGIAVPRSVVLCADGSAARELGGLSAPFVVKVVSPDVIHKSDVGGVRINLGTAQEVDEAIAEMRARPQLAGSNVLGYLVEEMAPPGIEIVIGGTRDPYFGPLVMVGIGGIFVEVLADVAFRICPISRRDAAQMIEELKGSALLKGARGAKPVSQQAIIETLLKVGGENGLLMQHASDFSEVDINPLIVSERAAVAVDARFILA